MKPCPFCNSQVKVYHHPGGLEQFYCSNKECPVNETVFTEEQWENRPTEARLIKLNEPVVPTPEDAKFYPTDF